MKVSGTHCCSFSHIAIFFKPKERKMKKQLMALIVGSVMSTAAFAVEPAASPMVLSDSQMDTVTAGTKAPPKPRSTSTVTNTQTAGDTINVGINPTVGANLALINTGGQNVGAYNPQSGSTQIIRR
jgi:hypothetical protein